MLQLLINGMLLDAGLARVRRRRPHKRRTETIPEPVVQPTPQEIRLRRRRREASIEALPLHIPRLSQASSVVSKDELAQILAHSPVRFRGRDCKAVFSTMRDGVCLSTLYSRVAGKDPVLLLVRDTQGATFGCYSSVPWRAEKHYFGSGESYVFTVRPALKVFPWTRQNSFFQLGTPQSMAIGGGGKFAIFLDSMLERGSSGASDTYGNTCLASSDEFIVVVVEAYKLVVPAKLNLE